MSQGPIARSRPSSTSPHEEKQKRLPSLSSRTLPPIQNGNSLRGPTDLSSNGPSTQNVSARQLVQTTPVLDQRCSRPIGMQNLLNPTSNGESTNTPNWRRSGESLDSPTGMAPLAAVSRAATPSLPAPTLSKRSPASVSLPSFTPPSSNAYPPVLGRSPGFYAPNVVTTVGQSATMDAKQSPFVLPRDHTVIGGSTTLGLPDMNKVTSLSGDSHSTGGPSSRSPTAGRRDSQDSTRYDRMQTLLGKIGGMGNGSHPAPSQSDSPSTQYSSYSQVSRQTPPAQSNVSTGQPQSFFTNPFNASGSAGTVAPTTFDVPAMSGGGTGGSTYQMMTLDTENGPIQRNATASHRFRQRRKEKERETSSNIAKLEQQIRDVEEEREFYREERDYFRTLASRIPGQSHLLPRPVSPRQRRRASVGGTMAFGNGIQFQGPESGSRNNGRNTKRRTSSYVPPSGPAPQVEGPSALHNHQQGSSNLGNTRALLQEPLSIHHSNFDSSTKR